MSTILDYLNNTISKYSLTLHKIQTAIFYLEYYGYLIKKDNIEKYSIEEIMTAVRKFREIFHLENSSEIDNKVIRAMVQPRCGRPDFEEQREELRAWRKKNLKIYVAESLMGFTRLEFEKLLMSYLPEIEKVCGLQFDIAPNVSSADILIDVGQGSRDDFDGAGSTLAYAYLPNENHSGQLKLRFDGDETWITDRTKRGILIKNVFLHESLHSLGISHTNVQSQLMNPFYNPSIAIPQSNDIAELQARYGKPIVITPPPIDPPVIPPTGDKIRITLDVEKIHSIDIPGFRCSRAG